MNNIQQLVTQTKAANPSATAQEVFNLINNSRTIPNPVARGQVPSPYTRNIFLGILTDAEKAALASNVILLDYVGKVMEDRVLLVTLINSNADAIAMLSVNTKASLLSLLEGTIPDPSWQSTVTQPLWADFNLRPVYIGECA